MNYRHHYHAGGAADLLKHMVLAALLRRLLVKPRPLCVLDTHAGAGVYGLDDEMARKTGEASRGVARLWGARGLPEALADLMRVVAAFNPDGALRVYPGSPALARALLRADDRLVACELQPGEARKLQTSLAAPTPGPGRTGECRVAVHVRDGYEALGALLPPVERRGLVVVDPPYERPDEFAAALAGLQRGHARWPTGCYVLWYPIRGPVAAGKLHAALLAGPMRRILCVELRAGAEPGDGSGVIVVNPPWQVDEALRDALPALAGHLGERGADAARVEWLVGE
jgi:23S rRNA (adenine2030-N6)-methyltransferase